MGLRTLNQNNFNDGITLNTKLCSLCINIVNFVLYIFKWLKSKTSHLQENFENKTVTMFDITKDYKTNCQQYIIYKLKTTSLAVLEMIVDVSLITSMYCKNLI